MEIIKKQCIKQSMYVPNTLCLLLFFLLCNTISINEILHLYKTLHKIIIVKINFSFEQMSLKGSGKFSPICANTSL